MLQALKFLLGVPPDTRGRAFCSKSSYATLRFSSCGLSTPITNARPRSLKQSYWTHSFFELLTATPNAASGASKKSKKIVRRFIGKNSRLYLFPLHFLGLKDVWKTARMINFFSNRFPKPTCFWLLKLIAEWISSKASGSSKMRKCALFIFEHKLLSSFFPRKQFFWLTLFYTISRKGFMRFRNGRLLFNFKT